ncbi:MAG TPA: magnesium/cobalt transporter CorA [Flavipsychrobacter sp.]|nr:magnesium/cobalt transporter CorA [Flavipsychrobacter sp.]
MALRKRVKGLANVLREWGWDSSGKRPVTVFNPTRYVARLSPGEEPVYTRFHYSRTSMTEDQLAPEDACSVKKDGGILWINVDGLRQDEVEKICTTYNIHQLAVEDILSVGQSAKMDEIGDVVYCLLPMIYYNGGTGHIEAEQVSIVLGKGFVLSFQEDKTRDVFNPVRDRLRVEGSKLRERDATYLCYSLIDIIVDSYFGVLEKMNERIDKLEDNILLQKEKAATEKVSILRREVMFLRRLIVPVRDLVAGFIRSENPLVDDRQNKYFKDIMDHVNQAHDYVDAHREILMNLQDVFNSQINLRLNEVMKIFTLVAVLLAPATVIGGIFGMNFDVIPLSHHGAGFWVAVAAMLVIPLLMLIWFKRKGWF